MLDGVECEGTGCGDVWMIFECLILRFFSLAGMRSFACPAICCAVDGGAGALVMSLPSISALWKGGEGSAGGFSSGGGMRSWY